MSQTSAAEAGDLILKLAHERLTVDCFFISATGVHAVLRGFVASATNAGGVVISASDPPIDEKGCWIRFNPFDRLCDFEYGDERDFPEEVRSKFATRFGNTILLMRFPESGELVSLHFTI